MTPEQRKVWESSEFYQPMLSPPDVYETMLETLEHKAKVLALTPVVRRLPIKKVSKMSNAVMAYMLMQPNQCHYNVQAYIKLDPHKETKAVLGWLEIDGCFCLHSVIKQRGKLFCITPTPLVPASEFIFRPDGKIVMREIEFPSPEGLKVKYSFERMDHNVPSEVYDDPRAFAWNERFMQFVEKYDLHKR